MSKGFLIFMLLFILATFIFIRKFKPVVTTKKTKVKMDGSNFYSELITFLHGWEGGLTDDTTDTASNFPLRGTYTVKNKVYTNPHTNKGVTYRTFIDSAKVHGFEPSNSNFFDMPNDIWLKIYKDGYYKKASKISNNEVLNVYMSLWFWGGWAKTLMPIERVAKVIGSNISDKQKLKQLVDLRKEYFVNVVKANPKNAKYLKGWTDRATDFYEKFNKYVN